ncbi:DUF1543 domain-containing protein [Francisella philomiragia]|uniref:DUF1543 domain-containing protein n=1 Tax=Francisella philomiragia TaxID=28110 RepID=A0AAW3DCW8_9GAMM|nr:DUF1543 domain-containing protein [Francisella philomiragia]KFJ43954.1 hypothetical protein DR78_1455 [Francisella philomiragia]MBK2255704.1 DUF1543 domain-containing protein [Francisella philomiragia]MBK2274023.1 DUF1543 domain-containing protein [Francisella philomiragia]MBK2277859.1 DUF1543 domain-containing protein [Francisella philomiragia]MBK2281805.1 DUF1543 domain-containing protein [Francisella philomiragia]
MSQLFIVYLGESAPKANIELHDVQFVIGNTIEDTYEQLRQNWFGTVKGLHLDSYKALKGADGYKISIQDKPQNFNKKLYFVNLGGYDESKLNELHEFALFVAADKTEAKEKAKQSLLKNFLHQHKDNLMEVDDCLELSSIGGKYIHLTSSDEEYNLRGCPR